MGFAVAMERFGLGASVLLDRVHRVLFAPVAVDRFQVFADAGFRDAELGVDPSPPAFPAEARDAYLRGYADNGVLVRAW